MVESENSFQARWSDRMFLILYLWTATCQRKKTWTWASCDCNSCSHHNRSCDESSTEGERQKRCQPAWRRGFSQWVPLRWTSSGRHQSGLDRKPETTPTAHFIFTLTHFFTRRYVRVVRWLTMTMRMKVLYRNHCYRKIAARNLLDTIVSLIWPNLERTLHFDGTTRLQHF